jgi:hypothetical protein
VKTLYPVRAVFRFVGRLPKSTQISGRHITGTLGPQIANVHHWQELPHRVFANLPRFDLVKSCNQALLNEPGRMLRRDAAGRLLPELVDLKAMEQFVKKYGSFRVSDDIDETKDHFGVDAADFTDAQDNLRKAWAGDIGAIDEIEAQVKYALEARLSVKAGGVELTTDNLRSLICVLFLLDSAAGKTAVCANPECPAPYFLRKRKDQKFCERGQCTVYAQRRYALGWWNRKGSEIRAKRLNVQAAKRKRATRQRKLKRGRK